MFLYKWRYWLFSFFLLAELASWLVFGLPAGMYFDNAPDFVFTTFMILFLCSPLICILYWVGLTMKYWNAAWGHADALAFAISIIAFLPKALSIAIILAEEN